MEGEGCIAPRFRVGNTHDVDPFLPLDDFSNDVQEDYLRLSVASASRDETIRYVLAGTVEHGDEWGNRG